MRTELDPSHFVFQESVTINFMSQGPYMSFVLCNSEHVIVILKITANHFLKNCPF